MLKEIMAEPIFQLAKNNAGKRKHNAGQEGPFKQADHSGNNGK